MTRFKLATRTQMVVMTIAWLGALVALDYWKNPHLRAAERMPEKAPGAALSRSGGRVAAGDKGGRRWGLQDRARLPNRGGARGGGGGGIPCDARAIPLE